MPLLPHRRLIRILMALGIALVATTGASAVADEHKSESSVNLSLRPVDQPGAYFELTLDPGESQELQTELGNHGTEAMDVRTYPADAYTLVNGGFGAEERDSKPTGTTTWLDYPAEVLPLSAGQASVHSFTVTVPADTKPGQYITSIVLENDAPIEGTGSVALDQIVRQALPVAIRVPGSLEPEFEFSAASHRFVADHSVVGVGIANTGNAHLAPIGELTIRDDAGEVVGETSVTMNTLFAGTETQVETALNSALTPGDYTLSASMTDPNTDVTATATDLPFTIDGEPAEEAPATPQQGTQNNGNNALLYLLGAVILALLAVLAVVIRRNQAQSNHDPGQEKVGSSSNS